MILSFLYKWYNLKFYLAGFAILGMTVDNVMSQYNGTQYYISYVLLRFNYSSFTLHKLSQGKHGKIRGMRYDFNISFIFCTYSQCHKMDKVKSINMSGS
jgi:hypothetical protein